MTKRRKKLLVALALSFGGCVGGAIALVPGGGPPLLAALPDADVLVKADNVDALWKTLSTSERFARIRTGAAWKALAETPVGRDAGRAIERLVADGAVTRWRASHLVGREAGVSVVLAPDGAPAHWVAAFRIDTVARVAELAAGRLFMRGQIARSSVRGESLATFTDGRTSVHWARVGDLLIAAGSASALEGALASARGAGATPGDRSTWAGRFESPGAVDGTREFRLGLRLVRPEEKLIAALKLVADDRERMDAAIRAVGLPAPVEALALTLQIRDGELLEDAFLHGAVGVPGSGESAPERRPEQCHLWWQFRPGREEAIGYAWNVMMYLQPPQGRPLHAGRDEFKALVQARLGGEVAIALAEQPGVESPTGGFPAQYIFFRLVGAESLREGFEELLRRRSLGIYEQDADEPVTYPYLVKHRMHDAWVYEMVIRNTRRHDGYRPALAIAGSNLIYCSSLNALKAYLGGAGQVRSPRGRAWVESLEGTRVFALDWRTPGDVAPLKNSYDYLTEQIRFAPPATAEVLSDQVEYDLLWDALEDAVGEIELQQRLGVRAPGGMRMRARWVAVEQP